jgi:hypothetical protein
LFSEDVALHAEAWHDTAENDMERWRESVMHMPPDAAIRL